MTQKARDTFGPNANAYVTSKNHAKGEDLELLKALISNSKAKTALDIATGAGHAAKTIAPYVQNVIAVDVTPEMLAAAQNVAATNRLTNIEFVEATAEKLPFSAFAFDLAVCRIAAHHFDEVSAFLREAYRVLKEGGRLYLLDNVALEEDALDRFYNKLETYRDPSHVRAYKKSEWLKMAEEAGFTVKQLHTFCKQFDFHDWTARVQLNEAKKRDLGKWMLAAGEREKQAYAIKEVDGAVSTFCGQSILLELEKN